MNRGPIKIFIGFGLFVNLIFLAGFGFFPAGAHAQQQEINIRAQQIIFRSRLFPSPSSETLLVDSTFQVGIYLDTLGNNINSVELNLKFSPDKLAIIKPSVDKSLIGVWLEPPTFSNVNGTARLIGIVPGGIVTGNGLVATITFKTLKTGEAKLEISRTSQVLANDGQGTGTEISFGTGVYTIAPRPPGGVKVFSETHPFEDQWYNNNSPVLNWEKDPGVTDFSFVLDNEPSTIPDNTSDTSSTIKSFEKLGDGLSYFHIKAKKEEIWGGTTNFLLRIDTSQPASFKPSAEILRAGTSTRVMASFFTTDALSGIDHYEIGVIGKDRPVTESPLFVQIESPYQLPQVLSENLRLIIRALDKAGNVRNESVDVDVRLPQPFLLFIRENPIIAFLFLIALFILLIILHYVFGHKIIAHARHVLRILKIIEKREHDPAGHTQPDYEDPSLPLPPAPPENPEPPEGIPSPEGPEPVEGLPPQSPQPENYEPARSEPIESTEKFPPPSSLPPSPPATQ